MKYEIRICDNLLMFESKLKNKGCFVTSLELCYKLMASHPRFSHGMQLPTCWETFKLY